MPAFVQSNTVQGLVPKVVATGSDLTGKEGYFAVLADDATNGTVCSLPTSGALCQFVVEDGADTPDYAVLRPLETNRQIRVVAGTTLAGAVEVQTDGNGRAVAASSNYWVLGITEERCAASGNYVLIRPALYKKA